MTVDERLDFLEFRQELLFEDSGLSRLLFEYKVTREQYNAIMDIFDAYRNKIEAGENVHHGLFEQRIYQVVPQHDGNYHFAEFLAQENHRRGSWEEVFETLYGDMPKYQGHMKNRD
ncbi:DUF1878 domain-containing protein [Neobacillus novalis]|uniref:DUF1878 domain-containing protein n=1 Tax=Neobacillus novalis TaxID=220687 RepID=A0AA95MVB2_9BACI|nr:DUF1878 domain-containing protein [Neobacillus novalis]WHY88720.1 DUF1878 domain-containing protein [Neobacillus novalis]